MTHLMIGLAFFLGAGAETTPLLKLDRGIPLKLHLLHPDQVVAGRLEDTDAGSVTIVSPSGQAQRIPRDELRRVEYRLPDRDRLEGAKRGAAIGGLAGLAACIVVAERNHSGPCDQCLIACGFAGTAAAVPGGAIGFVIGTSHWEDVPRDGFTLAGSPSPRRATVGLRFSFGR